MSSPGDATPPSDLILYQTEDGKTRIQCRFEDESLWLTQAQIGDLYQKDVKTINEHLLNVYEEKELAESSTIRKFRIVRIEGKREVAREISHYSLQAILAVGFRVRSQRGTQFRQWANERLSEYLVKGFAMDDERLRQPVTSGLPDYFDELLERIRDIRASEQRLYLRVKDILALAADYQPSDAQTQTMFKTVQNKLHFAVTGLTAPEIIAQRVTPDLRNMGLTSWSGARVIKKDVTIAKNYLKEDEIKELNRIVGMFLDYAEDQARRRKQVFLNDWPERLDAFLSFNDREVLLGLGSVSRDAADQLALAAYEQFNERRRLAAEEQGADDAMAALEDAARMAERRSAGREQKP
jgi:Virulence protein